MPKDEHRSPWADSPLSGLLHGIGAIFTRCSERGWAADGFLRLLWHATGIAALVYAAGVVLGMGFTAWAAERVALTAGLIYLPAGIWLLPMGVLLPLALLVRPWSALPLLVAPLAVWVYLDYSFAGAQPIGGDRLVIMSANVGQRNRSNIVEKIEHIQPDIVALQEAMHFRGHRILPGYFNAERISEYQLLSRFPILKSEPIRYRSVSPYIVAVRHELDYKGRRIVLYNVHLPTPRSDFEKLRGPGAVRELSDFGSFLHADKRSAFAQAMSRRAELGRRLSDRMAMESLPVIAMGDFNMPRRSYNYRRFNDLLVDLHDVCGSGTGHTFPGHTSNPIALFRSWMRLDYIFVSEHWRGGRFLVEGDSQPQHRAVIGEVELEGLGD